MSCTPFEKPATGNSNISMANTLNDDGECMDQKLELWFAKFNQLQTEGYDMNEANEKALAEVAAEFKDCRGKQSKHMATKEDSIEE